MDIDVDDFGIPEDTDLDKAISRKGKKKVNGQKKGSRYELSVCKDLSKRFNEEFRRVPRSGAFMGGVNRFVNKDVRKDAQEILSGDIITPIWFHFTIECKNYADSPKLHNLFSIGDKTLDGWVEQCKIQEETAGKPWVLIFKITSIRGKQYAAIDYDVFCQKNDIHDQPVMLYNGIVIMDYNYFFESIYPKYDSGERSKDTNMSLDDVDVENIV